MKIRTVFLLALAVACGTAGSRLTKRLLSSPTEASDPGPERIAVFAAKEALTAGSVLSEPDRLFEERTLAKGEEPGQAILRLHQLRGRKLTKPIAAHAIITADCLADDESGLASLNREGRRPLAVAVQAPGGYLFLPESRVDLIWTDTGRAPAESRIIAQDLPLLGVQNKAGGSAVATVAAKPDDAERLTQAAVQGSLRLVLRE